jgi:hypothetical protein
MSCAEVWVEFVAKNFGVSQWILLIIDLLYDLSFSTKVIGCIEEGGQYRAS